MTALPIVCPWCEHVIDNCRVVACEKHAHLVGSVSVVEGEASGIAGQERVAQASTPSNSSTSLAHAITVPPSVEEDIRAFNEALAIWLIQLSGRDTPALQQALGDLLPLRDKLIAAVRSAQPPSQAWRDISSAPKDRPILATDWAHLRPRECRWWERGDNSATFSGWYPTNPNSPRVHPTHWMPLPSPPSQARQETDQEHDLGAVSATEGVTTLNLPHDLSYRTTRVCLKSP